ncbi:zinc finger protein-like 1-like [Heracleum sosnowskyi]|uniref:Zinc finger protein-like 1-like n=1 Tax=Heracleum sosnowskyi TaxID=360622 RepID=A0AAD8IIR2_9APIA|nr:zinc finger protein-like 1-like [Heracleum sosnowskyi]
MVVCKCRKATKLYCFVHKVPVCGECVCFPEHQICVIRTYSEWVIDGDYDWPPRCCKCHSVFEERTDGQTTRLGCLHVIHTSCLASHIKDFPPHTAPAGYVCPACATSIWPPKMAKDSGSLLHSKLKEAILQTGYEKNLFGNHIVSFSAADSRDPPPAFASDPLIHVSGNGGMPTSVGKDGSYSGTTGSGSTEPLTIGMEGIDDPSAANPSLSSNTSNFMINTSPPGASTRKSALQAERQSSGMSYYADDEDANRKKYTRRGSIRNKFLRLLLPFWSSALPTLPVTVPSRKDTSHADEVQEGRTRHPRTSRMDPRKILLIIAIMACMATMGILYYRLAQRGFGEQLPEEEPRQQ